MADAPPAASGQRSVTLDIGAIGSGLGDGIDIEEAYRLVAAAMENDAELMAAVGAARERAVETVRGNLAAKSARGGLEEYRRALDAEFEGTIDALTASMGMTASPDQKNTFNSAFDALAAANASIYKSSADFRRECVDLLAKRALAELGSPVPADFDAQSRISDYIGELSREQAAKTISSLHGLKVSEVLAAGRKRIAQALGELMRRLRAVPKPAKATAEPRQASPAPAPATAAAPVPREAGPSPAAEPAEAAPRTEACGGEAGGRGGRRAPARPHQRHRHLAQVRTPGRHARRHAAHAKVALDEIDEPATADNIVEFKPRDAERERERSAAIDSRVPAVPPARVAAAAGAACASAAAPVRNYSLNLR